MLRFQFSGSRYLFQLRIIEVIFFGCFLGSVLAILLGVHHDIIGVLRLEVVTGAIRTLTVGTQVHNEAALVIVLLGDGTAALEAELTEATQLDAELVALTLVVAQLDDTELDHLLRCRLLSLHSLDAVETTHKADHVVLEELDELRVEWWYIAWLICTAFLPLRIVARVLLILQPTELVGDEAIFVE